MMTSSDYIEMAAYAMIEPFGEDRADIRAASISYAAFIATQGNEDGLKETDFLPDVKAFTDMMQSGGKQSIDEMEAIFKAIAQGAPNA